MNFLQVLPWQDLYFKFTAYTMSSPQPKSIKSFKPKLYWREILAVFIVLLAIFFFRNERKELQGIFPRIRHANPFWLFAGSALTILYFFAQGGMYRKSFAAIGLTLR